MKSAKLLKTYALAAIKSKEKCTDDWGEKIIIVSSSLYTNIKDSRSTNTHSIQLKSGKHFWALFGNGKQLCINFPHVCFVWELAPRRGIEDQSGENPESLDDQGESPENE